MSRSLSIPLSFSLLTVALAFTSIAHADLTMTFGGDINFNKNKQVPLADGVQVGGRVVGFSETMSGIKGLIDGDLNFANIETVVTDEKLLPAQAKTFVFRSHPNAIRQLFDIGFNLFSLANNHSYNHGFGGLNETLDAMDMFRSEGHKFTFAGIERTREGFQTAKTVYINGHTVAFAAIGITDDSFRATASKTGVLSYRNDADYELVLKSLREATADLKILSVHSGIEMKTSTEVDQRARLERALKEGDVDLVLGHHPHVVRPVALVDGRAIFYSLGNYLMLGAADISGRGLGMDYGLFARAHFGWDASARRLRLQAVEAIPLTNMQIQPKPLGARAARDRIAYLNKLSLADLGTKNALEFKIRADGSGVACIERGSQDVPFSARAHAVCP